MSLRLAVKKSASQDVLESDGYMEDRELVRECLDGKVESYKEIMTKYGGSAMAAAMNMMMNVQDAEDACQEAFVRAFRNLGRFDPERSFKNWFFAILSNICLDHLRGRKRRKNLVNRFMKEDAAASVVRGRGGSSPGREIDPRLLARLAPKERLCLHLWAQEDCSPKEIASILGCTRSTANVHLHRARVKIKSALREEAHA